MLADLRHAVRKTPGFNAWADTAIFPLTGGLRLRPLSEKVYETAALKLK